MVFPPVLFVVAANLERGRNGEKRVGRRRRPVRWGVDPWTRSVLGAPGNRHGPEVLLRWAAHAGVHSLLQHAQIGRLIGMPAAWARTRKVLRRHFAVDAAERP